MNHYALTALLALAVQIHAQDNPLNAFISAAQSGANVINSANAQGTATAATASPTASPTTTPTAAAASSAAAAASSSAAAAGGGHHGLSTGAIVGIVVGAVVGVLLIAALIIGCCCGRLCRRGRRSRKTVGEMDEVKEWHPVDTSAPPLNPGRTYATAPHEGRRGVSMEQHSPTQPLMADGGAAVPHGRQSQAPSLSHHPALRDEHDHHYGRDAAIVGAGVAGVAGYEAGKHHSRSSRGSSASNPFEPAPPISRRPVGSQPKDMATGAAAAAAAAEKQRRQSDSRSRSRSQSRPRSAHNPGALPTHHDANRPPTPFGLSGIGQPMEDKHVQVLQSEPPSEELRRSLHLHESSMPGAFPANEEIADIQPPHRSSRGYSTPPQVPSRSPQRAMMPYPLSDEVKNDSNPSYTTTTTTTSTSSSNIGEHHHQHQDPYAPAIPNHPQRQQQQSPAPFWEEHTHPHCKPCGNTPPASPGITAPPPIPWEEEDEYAYRPRRNSHSPRQSMSADGRERRRSRSSANGQSKRLRFEDLQPEHGNNTGGVYSGREDEGDGYEQIRWSQGVGEAL